MAEQTREAALRALEEALERSRRGPRVTLPPVRYERLTPLWLRLAADALVAVACSLIVCWLVR